MILLLVAVAIATLVACEVALRLPLGRILTTLSGSAKQAMKVLSSKKISDTWKEKMLPVYAGRIMKASLSLFVCLIAIALPVVVIASLVTGSVATGSALLMQPLYLVEMIAIGVVYIWVRAKVLA